MFLIAQRFGVSLNALIAANPHISNPSQIFPEMCFVCLASSSLNAECQLPARRDFKAATPSSQEIPCSPLHSGSG